MMLLYVGRVDSLRETPHPLTLVPLSLPAVDRSGLVPLVHMVRHFTADKLQTAHHRSQGTTFDRIFLKNLDWAAPRGLATVHI